MTHPVSKASDEVKDYELDWTNDLGSDTISSSTWSADAGLTIQSPTVDSTSKKTVITLAGGTLLQAYRVVNKIITTGGRTMEDSLTVFVTNN